MPKLRALLGNIALCSLLLACGGNKENNDDTDELRNWYTSRTFTDGGEQYSPADFQRMSLAISFSVPESKARGIAEIRFRATSDGFAYLLSDAALSSATLDAQPVAIATRRDPDDLNTLHVISRKLRAGSLYTLKVSYELPSRRVGFQSGGVGFLTSMSDINQGNFFEAYAPASFEYDSFELSMKLEVLGSAVPAHSLFANGVITQNAPATWSIEFPGYFTSSSFYVHLTNTPLFVRTATHPGKEKAIPITVYSRDQALADQAITALPQIFDELEATYGPYTHASFLAYISGRGGMEYGGATITSLGALGHELTHSWFARGVIPSDGRSGWIDEAIASWRDNGYFRASQLGTRAPTNLARISAFQRFTVGNSYVDGRFLLSEIDLMLAGSGGLRPALSEFYATWKRKSIRTADFRSFLEQRNGLNLEGTFQRYVYADTSFSGDGAAQSERVQDTGLHPPPLTEKEIRWLR